MKTRPLLLFGGGLDSAALAVLSSELEPVLIYFSYGQKALEGELRSLHYFSRTYHLNYKIVQIDPSVISDSPLTKGSLVTDASKHAQNYIPGRNLLFSAFAFSFAAANKLSPILLGASPAPPESAFNDAKLIFAKHFNLLTSCAYPGNFVPELGLPLLSDGSREDYLARALKKDRNLFRRSFTCYESSGRFECGDCVHCQQKAVLAEKLGAETEPTLKMVS